MNCLKLPVVLGVFFSVASFAAIAQEQTVKSLPFTLTLPALNADGLEIPKQRLDLADKNGWLVATLTAEPDELEWKIVLAKLTPETKAVVKVHPVLPLFSVQYGPWFIRESLGRLRVNRQPKDARDDGWKQIGDAPMEEALGSALHLFMVPKDQWLWICTAPTGERKQVDTLIRFQHIKLNKDSGAMSFADGRFAEVFAGDARCHDEGDLLIASRIATYAARSILAATEKKATLIGLSVPALTGKPAGNLPMPKSDELKGKVVLIDFWATWCGPCIKKLPEVNALQKKYGDRGLVILGVHSSQNADRLQEFLRKQPVHFPTIVDDGQTEKAFAVSQLPTYFLVGRDGKVKAGYLSTLPTEAQIEAELKVGEKPGETPAGPDLPK
jgi:thiol-disulfide isomerase/thioredoxin